MLQLISVSHIFPCYFLFWLNGVSYMSIIMCNSRLIFLNHLSNTLWINGCSHLTLLWITMERIKSSSGIRLDLSELKLPTSAWEVTVGLEWPVSCLHGIWCGVNTSYSSSSRQQAANSHVNITNINNKANKAKRYKHVRSCVILLPCVFQA